MKTTKCESLGNFDMAIKLTDSRTSIAETIAESSTSAFVAQPDTIADVFDSPTKSKANEARGDLSTARSLPATPVSFHQCNARAIRSKSPFYGADVFQSKQRTITSMLTPAKSGPSVSKSSKRAVNDGSTAPQEHPSKRVRKYNMDREDDSNYSSHSSKDNFFPTITSLRLSTRDRKPRVQPDYVRPADIPEAFESQSQTSQPYSRTATVDETMLNHTAALATQEADFIEEVVRPQSNRGRPRKKSHVLSSSASESEAPPHVETEEEPPIDVEMDLEPPENLENQSGSPDTDNSLYRGPTPPLATIRPQSAAPSALPPTPAVSFAESRSSRDPRSSTRSPFLPKSNINYNYYITRTRGTVLQRENFTPRGRFLDKTLAQVFAELVLGPDVDALSFILQGPNLYFKDGVDRDDEDTFQAMLAAFAKGIKTSIRKNGGAAATLTFTFEVRALRADDHMEEEEDEEDDIDVDF